MHARLLHWIGDCRPWWIPAWYLVICTGLQTPPRGIHHPPSARTITTLEGTTTHRSNSQQTFFSFFYKIANTLLVHKPVWCANIGFNVCKSVDSAMQIFQVVVKPLHTHNIIHLRDIGGGFYPPAKCKIYSGSQYSWVIFDEKDEYIYIFYCVVRQAAVFETQINLSILRALLGGNVDLLARLCCLSIRLNALWIALCMW